MLDDILGGQKMAEKSKKEKPKKTKKQTNNWLRERNSRKFDSNKQNESS